MSGLVIAGFVITISVKALNKQDNIEDQQVAQGVEVIKQLEIQDVVQVEEQIEAIKAHLRIFHIMI